MNDSSIETNRNNAAHRLKLLDQYERIVSAMPDGIALIGDDYRYRMANPSYLQQIGTPHDDIVGRSVAEILGQACFEHAIKQHLDRCFTGETVHFELRDDFPASGRQFMSVSCTPCIGPDGAIDSAIVSTRSSTTPHQSAENVISSEQRFRAIFDNVLDAILIADDQGRYIDANPAACALLGLSRQQLLTMTGADFLEPGLDFQAIWQSFLEQGVTSGEISLHCPDGRCCEVEFAAKAHFLPHRHLSVLRDISARKRLQEDLQQANERLTYIAHHDKLTDLANRRYCDDYLQQEWQRLAREGGVLSLILCDIDYFKPYNDANGHLAGDECLVKVARALSTAARRPADLVARYGGEEFLVILPNTDHTGAIDVAQTIQQEIAALHIPNKGSSIAEQLTLSLGIASTQPDRSLSVRQLVDRADQALYRAKRSGRDRYCLG